MTELENQLTKLGYSYKLVGKDIILVENFLPDSFLSEVKNIIDGASQEDWEKHYMMGVADLAQRKYGRRDVENLLEEGLIEITNHWHDKNIGLSHKITGNITEKIQDIFDYSDNLKFDGVGTLQRQYEGAELTEHVDNHADPKIAYAVIMYINDDYSEGELFFNRLSLELKPPAKSMLIFPSGENYLHGVRPPGPGAIRYVLPSFVRTTNKLY